MAWRISIGNLAQRAPRDPVAVSPAVSDSILPLGNLATGQPDEQAAFEWRSDGVYKADLDLNLLSQTSSRSDAPTGWRDLLLLLAGTPGLSTNPPDWGTYAGRTALRFYRPVVQDIDVMPGEDMKLEAGLYLPAASTATAVRILVIDQWSGKGWDGGAWASGGVVATQSSDDVWLVVSSTITADTARTVRSTYRVVIEPVATTYSATTYGYASMNGTSGSPALYAKADMAAFIGHNLPMGATVTIGSEAITLAPISCFTTFSAKFLQTWRLDIAMPAGNQLRPIIGEVWIGRAVTLTRGPQDGVGLSDGDPFQIRVRGAAGRVDVLSDQFIPAQAYTLALRTITDQQYEEWKNTVTRATRFGVDPLLLLPDSNFEGSTRAIHGRVGAVISYTVQRPGFRSFTIEYAESPFAGA